MAVTIKPYQSRQPRSNRDELCKTARKSFYNMFDPFKIMLHNRRKQQSWSNFDTFLLILTLARYLSYAHHAHQISYDLNLNTMINYTFSS